MFGPLIGLDGDVARYNETNPDDEPSVEEIMSRLVRLVPRFVTEGKNHATVAIGCTGGRHRSVRLVEDMAERLRGMRAGQDGMSGEDGAKIVVTVLHRELGAEPVGAVMTETSSR